MAGLYIVLEGIVGCGKSTQSKLLLEYLKKKFPKKEIILTREPGGSEIAEDIRKIVQGKLYDEKMDYTCEAYLYAASRAQTIAKIVKPVLEKEGIVISDRSFVSSLAYQGVARGLGINRVMEINKIALSVLPDTILYLKIDPSVGLSRTFDHEGDKFEKKDVEFFRKISVGYEQVSNLPELKKKWVTIDASGSIKQVCEQIISAVSSHTEI